MASSRYIKNKVYKDPITGKQYMAPEFSKLNLNNIPGVWLIWQSTLSVRKLALQFYNSEEYYWVILLANNVGIESDLKPGQKIFIPDNVNTIITEI